MTGPCCTEMELNWRKGGIVQIESSRGRTIHRTEQLQSPDFGIFCIITVYL